MNPNCWSHEKNHFLQENCNSDGDHLFQKVVVATRSSSVTSCLSIQNKVSVVWKNFSIIGFHTSIFLVLCSRVALTKPSILLDARPTSLSASWENFPWKGVTVTTYWFPWCFEEIKRIHLDNSISEVQIPLYDWCKVLWRQCRRGRHRTDWQPFGQISARRRTGNTFK